MVNEDLKDFFNEKDVMWYWNSVDEKRDKLNCVPFALPEKLYQWRVKLLKNLLAKAVSDKRKLLWRIKKISENRIKRI